MLLALASERTRAVDDYVKWKEDIAAWENAEKMLGKVGGLIFRVEVTGTDADVAAYKITDDLLYELSEVSNEMPEFRKETLAGVLEALRGLIGS